MSWHAPGLYEYMGGVTGEAVINVLQASTCRDRDIEPKFEPMPVREVPI